MEELKQEFLTKKNTITFLLLGILVLSLPLAVNLLKQQQILRSKASEEPPIIFKGSSVSGNIQSGFTATDSTIQVEIRSPMGPARP